MAIKHFVALDKAPAKYIPRQITLTPSLLAIQTHSPKARPPIAATRTAANNPVPLTLSPAAASVEPGETAESPDSEACPLSEADAVAVGESETVDSVTGSDELLKEVAEYGAEKV